MRLRLAVLFTLVLGGFALPARADYLFDFQFGADTYPGLVTNGPSEIVFRGPLGPGTLTYVSGSLNGVVNQYMPATITTGPYDFMNQGYVVGSGFYVVGDLNGPPYAIAGFDLETYGYVTGPGAYQAFQSFIVFEYPSLDGNGRLDLEYENDYTFGSLTVTDDTPPVATPEPGTWGLVGTGVLGLVGLGRRRFGNRVANTLHRELSSTAA